jgi:hypothetical protein
MVDYLRFSAWGLLLLPWSSLLSTVSHLSPVDHETSKHDSPHKIDSRVEPPKFPKFKFKLRQVNYSSQSNQGTDHLISQSPPWWIHWQHKSTKFEFRIPNTWSTASKPKAQEKLGKTTKLVNGTKSNKPSKKQRKALTQKLPRHSMLALPLDIIMFLLSTNQLARVLPTLCTFSTPLVMNSSNTIWEKHEMLCMRSKLGCFTRYTSRYLSNYTQPLCQDLQKQEWILLKRPYRDNYQEPWAKIWNEVNKQVKHVRHKHKDSYLNQNKHI